MLVKSLLLANSDAKLLEISETTVHIILLATDGFNQFGKCILEEREIYVCMT